VSLSARIDHPQLHLDPHVFVDADVLILQDRAGGSIDIGERVHISRDVALHTGEGGSITIGKRTWIGPRSQFMGYKAAITIGSQVLIAPNCSFYPYNHGIEPGKTIADQDLWSRGDIVVGDGAWLGAGVTVLSGVRIGIGAVIGAGSIVTREIPDGAVAAGAPAQVLKSRSIAAGNPPSLVHGTRAVLIRDTDGTIRFWNSGGQQMYGWAPAETIGQSSHRLFRTRFPEPLETIESALRKRGVWEGTLIHTRRDGSPIVVASHWELLAAGTQTPTILEINRDLNTPELAEAPVSH
jgi:PAS domain S-box-containing protein